MPYKLVIGEKSGRTKQIEIPDANIKALAGLKVGDTFKGESIDMPGFEFQIMGGSDIAGFPMRKDVPIAGRRKVLLVKGIGLRRSDNAARRRRTVAGGIIGPTTAQINIKVLKSGATPLFSEEDIKKMEEKKTKKAEPAK